MFCCGKENPDMARKDHPILFPVQLASGAQMTQQAALVHRAKCSKEFVVSTD
jgi:hypothetical protein